MSNTKKIFNVKFFVKLFVQHNNFCVQKFCVQKFCVEKNFVLKKKLRVEKRPHNLVAPNALAYIATSQKGMACTPRDPKCGRFSSFSLILAKFPPSHFWPAVASHGWGGEGGGEGRGGSTHPAAARNTPLVVIDVVSCCAVLFCGRCGGVVFRGVILCYVVLCCIVVLCCVVLCCVVLCCVVLCCVVWCGVVLCCVVLCCKG